MNKYLLNISYIGSSFRGIQKIVTKADPTKLDNTTVQGCIELGLRLFRPINEIKIHLSSRTDAGVHALNSAVHVDLENSNGIVYHVDYMTKALNTYFVRKNFPIRVIRTQHVPETFHCRYCAKGRTYLYRIAVAKEEAERNADRIKDIFTSYIPIEEIDKCYFIQSPLDIEKCKEVSKLFIGRHDFRSFMGANNQNTLMKHPMYTLRTISDITITPGAPVTCSFDQEKAKQLYNYWDIKIDGRSFLYKQVRRIVGTLLAVGSGKLTQRDVYEMLTIPSKNNWDTRVKVLPPYGLYLCKVHYNDEDLKFPENTTNVD